MEQEQRLGYVSFRAIVMFSVVSQFILIFYLFGSYIEQYQVFNYVTVVLVLSFVFSTLAFLPVMVHVLRTGTISLLERAYGVDTKRPIDHWIESMTEEYENYLAKAGEDALPFNTWLKEQAPTTKEGDKGNG